MRGVGSTEQAQRELEAMGPADSGWVDLTLSERIVRNPERYFAEARIAVSIEAPRQIAEEEAMRQKLAAEALKATQEIVPASGEHYI